MHPALRTALAAWAVVLLAAPALGQIPQPRLQSLLQTGGRAGESVEVTVRGTDLEGVNALWFDHPGLRAFHLKGQAFRVAIAPGTPAGLHDVRVAGRLGVSNPRIFVVGEQPEIREVEPNNFPAQATPIAINSVANGEIAATDIDCFAFEGKAGRRLFVDVSTLRIDSRLEAVVRAYGPDGRELGEATGPDPLLDLTLPADGRYVIKLHDVIYAGSSDHVYRLTLHDGPHIDAILPTCAPAETPTTFTVYGRNLGKGPCPELVQIDGHPVERLMVTLTLPKLDDADGRLGLDSGAVPSVAASRRGWTYRATTATGRSNAIFIAEATDPVVLEHEPNDRRDEAQEVALPCDIAGSFARTGDVDVYRFKGHKGDVWWIEAFAERIGSPADPAFVVQRVPEKGDPQDLAVGDDLPDVGAGPRFPSGSVDAVVRWQVPEDGVYQVTIHDLYHAQRGDPRLSYRLNVRPERPDFSLVIVPQNPTALDAPSLRAGGRVLLYAVALRKDGYNRPIRVEAVDLPAGLTCEPTIMAGNQNVVPVVLSAAEDAPAHLQAIRFVGRGLSGDRKELLDHARGSGVKPEVVHVAVSAGMTWPPQMPNGQPLPPPVRLTRGTVVAVPGLAPFQVDARPAHWDVAPGATIDLNIDVVRRAGFTEAVQLSAINLPPNMAAAAGTIAKDKTSGTLKLTVPANVPPGTYTLVVQGAGPFPFNKDPNAKDKPAVNVVEPSNPIVLTVRK